MVSHHPLSLMGEMYRSICTAILFSRPDKPPQTILVTSAQPNEGKTVTAINISMMLAQSSGPVLLIDADLHGGYCHKLLGLGNGNGLTNILTGNEDIKKFIKKTKVDNLSLLGRGTLPPNPAELLGSDKMRQTLEALSADFRFIIIDSAPLLAVSDTVLLSTKIDGVVLVARGGKVSRHVVRRRASGWTMSTRKFSGSSSMASTFRTLNTENIDTFIDHTTRATPTIRR